MENEFNIGSNPGLAVTHAKQITPAVINYGQDAKKTVLTKKRALD